MAKEANECFVGGMCNLTDVPSMVSVMLVCVTRTAAGVLQFFSLVYFIVS